MSACVFGCLGRRNHSPAELLLPRDILADPDQYVLEMGLEFDSHDAARAVPSPKVQKPTSCWWGLAERRLRENDFWMHFFAVQNGPNVPQWWGFCVLQSAPNVSSYEPKAPPHDGIPLWMDGIPSTPSAEVLQVVPDQKGSYCHPGRQPTRDWCPLTTKINGFIIVRCHTIRNNQEHSGTITRMSMAQNHPLFHSSIDSRLIASDHHWPKSSVECAPITDHVNQWPMFHWHTWQGFIRCLNHCCAVEHMPVPPEHHWFVMWSVNKQINVHTTNKNCVHRTP